MLIGVLLTLPEAEKIASAFATAMGSLHCQYILNYTHNSISSEENVGIDGREWMEEGMSMGLGRYSWRIYPLLFLMGIRLYCSTMGEMR
jgi:hypothetical protein